MGGYPPGKTDVNPGERPPTSGGDGAKKGGGEQKMVRPEGVEPPTYWFVASCSIQLSYGRTLRWMQPSKNTGIRRPEQTPAESPEENRERVVRPEGFEPPTLWFEARCSIQLSYGRRK